MLEVSARPRGREWAGVGSLGSSFAGTTPLRAKPARLSGPPTDAGPLAPPSHLPAAPYRPRGARWTSPTPGIVLASTLRERLGGPAWEVYQRLLAVADRETGITWATNRRLAARRGAFGLDVGEAGIRKACRRLAAAGLLLHRGPGLGLRWVTAAGEEEYAPAVQLKGAIRKIYLRRVLGAPAEGALGAAERFVVPPATVEFCAAPGRPGRGGRRAGAGAPKGNQNWRGRPPHGATGRPPRAWGRDGAHELPPEEPLEATPACPAEDYQRGAGTHNQRGAADLSSPLSISSLGDLRRDAAGEEDLPAGREGSFSEPEDEGSAGVGVGEPEPPLTPEEFARAMGLPLPEPPRAGERRAINPFTPREEGVGFPTIESVRLPSPPKLTRHLSEVELAEHLARAYRGAVESRWRGKRCFAFSRGKIERSKHFPALVAAARALLERDIAPAAWAAWSCDVWKKYSEKAGKPAEPPPVAWVYSAARVLDREGWFRHEGGAYTGGRVVDLPLGQSVRERYLGACHAARAYGYPVEVLVERLFPEGYEAAVEAARAEAQAERALLRRLADEGKWLW